MPRYQDQGYTLDPNHVPDEDAPPAASHSEEDAEETRELSEAHKEAVDEEEQNRQEAEEKAAEEGPRRPSDFHDPNHPADPKPEDPESDKQASTLPATDKADDEKNTTQEKPAPKAKK